MIRDIVSRSSDFTPKDLSGLAMWLDGSDRYTLFTGTYADRLTTTTNPSSDGDLLCRWEDKSGNLRHAYAFSDGTRAMFESADKLNGRTGTRLSGSRWDRPAFPSGPKTWFLVHKYDGGTPLYGAVCNNQETYMGLAISASTSYRVSFVRDNQAWVDSGFTQGTSPRVYMVNYTSLASRFWTIADKVSTLRQEVFSFGVAPAGASFISIPGRLYEVVAFNRNLSSQEILLMSTYINKKWNL